MDKLIHNIGIKCPAGSFEASIQISSHTSSRFVVLNMDLGSACSVVDDKMFSFFHAVRTHTPAEERAILVMSLKPYLRDECFSQTGIVIRFYKFYRGKRKTINFRQVKLTATNKIIFFFAAFLRGCC